LKIGYDNYIRIPLDHDQPTLPILAGSSNNQERPGSDLSMHNALHCVSSSYASAVTKHKKQTFSRTTPFSTHDNKEN